MRVRACCFNAFVDFLCELLRNVVGFRFRACCVVFVRVCFATSVLMRVLVCFVCNVPCDDIWFVFNVFNAGACVLVVFV